MALENIKYTGKEALDYIISKLSKIIHLSVEDYEIPDKSITLNKLSDEVGTVSADSAQPQDDHVLLWIDYSE